MPKSGCRNKEWQQTRRFVAGLFVVYAILIQALATPFLKAKAAELVRLDALAVLCLSDGAPGHEEPGQRKVQHGHGLDCCLPGLRSVALDAPVLIVSHIVFELLPDDAFLPAQYMLRPVRAPPQALTSVLQPRAPPVSIT